MNIWKFPLLDTDIQTVNMPQGAKIIALQIQYGTPALWAEVNPDAPANENRVIECFGTGQHIHCGMGVERVYLGTVQMHGGSLVLHFYERTGGL